MKPKCGGVVRIVDGHAGGPVFCGGRNQSGEALLDRRMGEPAFGVNPERNWRKSLDRRVGLPVNLATMKMLAIVLQPIETVTFESRKLRVQNSLGKIASIRSRRPGAGQGCKNQLFSFFGVSFKICSIAFLSDRMSFLPDLRPIFPVARSLVGDLPALGHTPVDESIDLFRDRSVQQWLLIFRQGLLPQCIRSLRCQR